MILRCLAVLWLVGAAPAWAADMVDWLPVPEPPELTPEQVALLTGGDILVENTHLEESGGAAQMRALFHAPAEAIWSLLGDCEANFRFVDGLRECRLESVSETQAVTWQSVKKHWLLPRLEYRFETRRQPMEWVLIRLIEGDLKHMAGSWRFDRLPGLDGLLVSHEIQVQPGMPAPRWLVRRTLRKDVVDMVACLRWVTDASGSPQQAARDKVRCP